MRSPKVPARKPTLLWFSFDASALQNVIRTPP
jgi:hypothetical protein